MLQDTSPQDSKDQKAGSTNSAVILGAGITGLSAGYASDCPIYEAKSNPGGICSSYYLLPRRSPYLEIGHEQRLLHSPENRHAYRFEYGGGHWIFGGDPLVHHFMAQITPMKSYVRESGVYFPDTKQYVPYPIQNQLRYFSSEIAMKALQEMINAQLSPRSVATMSEWLEHSFGPTLSRMFFHPFHQLYTAGLSEKIAPQDAYKSPVDLKLAVQGAFQTASPVGYNATFVYPQFGLDTLIQKIADQCQIYFNKQAIRILPKEHRIEFSDGTNISYSSLLSTLPLNRLLELTGLDVGLKSDPSPCVLVVNIGGQRTRQTPSQHWIYLPSSRTGIHRVGFYSNVDCNFLPLDRQDIAVSLYVEKAYPEKTPMATVPILQVCRDIVSEIQSWGWLGDIDICDATWIDTAYTWSWPNSNWRAKAQTILQQYQIYPIGRYARWTFQGIADSIRDGLMAGNCVAKRSM